jgi:glycosyltransferase involved in cell wall biosynthesis
MFNVWYFIDNKLGGVTSLNYNLISHPLQGEVQTVLEIEQEEWAMARANLTFPNARLQKIKYSNKGNAYRFLKQLRNMVPDQPGALVLNYENEMAMLDHHEVPQTTYQLVHDNYNVNLAKKYGHVVDVFICHNSVVYNELLAFFPDRAGEIFFLPHGVNIPENYRKHDTTNAPLRLLFLGRMTTQKGIFDLPLICEKLREAGVLFEWTCIGNGPELEALKAKWNPLYKVKFFSPAGNKEVLDICAVNDVFVLPTKFEGSPVSLLETMSAGLVPVITALPGGITDIVDQNTGFAIAMNDNNAFALAIITLNEDRALLLRMGAHCRQTIIERYDLKNTAVKYHELFSRYREYYKEKKLQKLKVGARLDQLFLPPGLIKAVRSVTNRFR